MKGTRALLDSLAASHTPNGSGYIRINCPFCPSRIGRRDSRKSFGYSPTEGAAKCFSCLFSFCTGAGHRVKFNRGDKKEGAEIRRADFTRLTGLMSRHMLPYHVEAMKYLMSRDLDGPEMQIGDLHYAYSGKETGRIIIPHTDKDGKWWGYTARQVPSLCSHGPKANAPRGMQDLGYQVYNGKALLEDTDCPCLVMEGAIDSLRFLPNAISTLGKADERFMNMIMSLIRTQGFMRPLVMCLDGDARKEQYAMVRRLHLRGVPIQAVYLPSGTDPDDAMDPDTIIQAAWAAIDEQKEISI